MENLEMDKLIAEATAALNDLVKSEQAVYEQELKKSEGTVQAAAPAAPATETKVTEPVKKSEETSKCMDKKEESSSGSSMKKDESSEESSGFENPAPESSGSSESSASSSPSESSSSDSSMSGSPSESSSGSDSSGSSDSSSGSSSGSEGGDDHVGQMLSELDDDKLQHLYMKCKSELMARMHRDGGQQEQAPAPQEAMAMSEKKDLEDKLAKKDAEIESLKKACGAVMEMTEKLTRRPVKKAITDIKFIDRAGETDLSKSEVSEKDLMKYVKEASKDYKKLGNLSKTERDTLIDYSVGRNKNREEIVKILSK